MSLDLDEFLQHELYLNRLASGGINTYVYPSLVDTYKAIRKILQAEEVITSTAQLDRVAAAISRAIDANGGWATLTAESLNEMALYETSWQAQFVGAAFAVDIKTPAEKKILSYVNNALMSLDSGKKTYAGVWEQFYRENLTSRTRAINGIVKSGYASGQTINQMSQRIRTVIDGSLKHEAESLARTGYQHYASQANTLMVEANKDVLKEWFYVVTFDSRTSIICQSISTKNVIGNRFKVNDPKAPNPPLHFGCRTRRIGLPKGLEPTGTRAALGAKASGKKEYELRKSRLRTKSQVTYRGKKDSKIFKPGQIKADTPLDSWLREQPDYYIRDTLKTQKRYDLFKKGGLSLKDFSDINGNPLSIEEVIQRHPVRAKRAGV